jgi:hypothetical protein
LASSGSYGKRAFAADALGPPLQIGSVAVGRSEIPLHRHLMLPDLPDTWARRPILRTVAGGAINKKHIDVYCDEEQTGHALALKFTIQRGDAGAWLGLRTRVAAAAVAARSLDGRHPRPPSPHRSFTGPRFGIASPAR